MQPKAKKILRTTAKIIAWTVGSIVTLLLLVIVAIQIPAVQQTITQKAIAFLEKKIGTKVTLESLYISFPKNIVVKGFYLEDTKKDTLLYAGKLSVNTDLWALTRHEIQLNDIHLENTTAFVSREANDSAFNFSFILKAFAGDSTAVPDTLEQKGWDFAVKTVTLDNIHAHYHDLLTGNHADVGLGSFEVALDPFDLKTNTYGIRKVDLENTHAEIVQTKMPEESPESSDAPAINLNLNEAGLKNIWVNYTQQATGQVIRLDLGETTLKANTIDLEKHVIDLDEFSLEKTFLSYQQLAEDQLATKPHPATSAKGSSQSSKQKASGQASPSTTGKAWKFNLGKFTLLENSIQYYDFRKPYTKGTVDFDHLWITHLNADARTLAMNGSDIAVDLRNLSFLDKSGFSLRSFKAQVNVGEDNASLKDLVVLTGNSRLQLDAQAEFESFSRIAETYPSANIRASINQSYVDLRDILFFKHDLLDSLPLKLSPATRISMDASVNGTVNNLAIQHFDLKTFADTQLKAKGTLAGLPDMNKLTMNLQLEKFFTTKADVIAVLPDTLLPDSIAPPEWINLNADYKGNLKKGTFQSALATNIGSMDLRGHMDLDSASATRGLGADLHVNQFDLGKLLMQDTTIGKLNLQASLNSQGLTREEMNAVADVTVHDFEFRKYKYQDLRLNARLRNNVLNGSVLMNDSSLTFSLKGDVDYRNDVPRYQATFDLKNANFNALHLTDRKLKARGTLDVNMATADFKILNGNLDLRKVAIFNGEKLYAVDSLLFASIDQKDKSEVKIDSDLLRGRFEGTLNLATLPDVLREYFNTYYSLHDPTLQKREGPQHFTFSLQLKKTDLLTEILLPKLTSFIPREITGDFDSERNRLDLKIGIDTIQYANIGVRSFLISTNSDSVNLNYNVIVDKINIDSMLIDGIEFNGTVSHDSIRTNFIVLDSTDRHKYVLGGTFFSRADEFEFNFNPQETMLNYVNWKIPRENFIRFGGPRLVAQNVTLTNGREKILLEAKDQAEAPITLGFRELNLEYLVSMVAQEKPLSGLLDGNINVFPGKAGTPFTADVKINGFSISEVNWGDMALNVKQTVQNRYDVDFSLISKLNNFTVNGYYIAGETPDMNLTATLGRFDLVSLQPITSQQLRNLKGTLTGKIDVKGTPADPKIDGGITFHDIQFLSTYLNSSFAIKDETIAFGPRGISLDKFEIVDGNKNTASIDGAIITRDYKKFRFNLNLLTDNFRLLNTTAKDNTLFYGKVDASINARVRGTMDNPSVDVNVKLGDGSNFTYVVPQTEASVLATQGIVKFVDKSFENDPFMKKIRPELADTVAAKFTGLDVTANIELNDKETMTVIIDPTTNDKLTVKGNTTLTYQMDHTGDMQLSGRYELTEGSYNFSFYKFLKRDFKIEKGSTITWDGDPTNAKMDVHALYQVETSPIDLMANQIAGMDQSTTNTYRQQFPFLVHLNIGGQLLKPELTFSLDMLDRDKNAFGGTIYARLQDINTRESDLNKQVFALLILKRFISDNPFESEAGGGLESTARNSVSKILTDQLNRLSKNVRGVELSFDVKSYEDYSSGQAEGNTKLQLGLSKSLLHNRLVVKVAGNVDVEGQNSNRTPTDYIGDLGLEYKLTDDGRFRITGFRNSNYDMIDGELIETGAGVIFIKDYETLRELFKSNAATQR